MGKNVQWKYELRIGELVETYKYLHGHYAVDIRWYNFCTQCTKYSMYYDLINKIKRKLCLDCSNPFIVTYGVTSDTYDTLSNIIKYYAKKRENSYPIMFYTNISLWNKLGLQNL